MKSAMLTDSNKTEMAEADKKTFSIRKAWIDNKNKKPTGKEVIERFPWFLDMLVAVRYDALLFLKNKDLIFKLF